MALDRLQLSTATTAMCFNVQAMLHLLTMQIAKAQKAVCLCYLVERAAKQKTVTTSTTEAELLALSYTTKDYMWWKRLLSSLELDLEEAGDEPVLCDNKQTVQVLQKDHPVKLKHVDIQNHWLTGGATPPCSRLLDPYACRHKALPRQRHDEFVRMLNLVDINHLIEDSNKKV
jgi:hypothetical protein